MSSIGDRGFFASIIGFVFVACIAAVTAVFPAWRCSCSTAAGPPTTESAAL